jgi:tetratricopeptide (TPR) repeat protein
MCAWTFGAQVEWLLGYPDKAVALGEEALALAERIAHPFSSAVALQYNAMLHLDRGEPDLALQRLESAESLAAEQRLGFILEPQLLRGAPLTSQGAFDEAAACLREGLAGPAGATRSRCYGLAMLADALIRQGKYDEGIAVAREGLSTEAYTGHRQWKAELHRLEGIALCGLNRLDESQSALEEAMRVARSQKAKAGAETALELGPGTALSHMASALFRDGRVRAVEEFRTLAGLRTWLQTLKKN